METIVMPPRVVIVGGLGCCTLFWSVKRGFERAGCDVYFFHNKIVDADGRKVLDPQAMTQVRYAMEMPVDLLLWFQPQNGCPREQLAHLQKLQPSMKLVMMSFDDPHMIYRINPQGLGVFDIGVTCCEGAFDWYRAQGMEPLLGYPPVDVDMFGNATFDPAFEHDVTFAATCTHPPDLFPDAAADRIEMIRAIADLGDVAAYGWCGKRSHDWQRLGPELAHVHRRWLYYKEHPSCFFSSKINLSSHVEHEAYKYLNERVPLIMGAGGFLLCDRVPGIDEMLVEGKDLAYYDDVADLRETVKYYLAHEDERKAIARAGKAKALRLFNNELLARRILEAAGIEVRD